jgi:23S rRNA (adenine2503-C2)-methyltransferase
VTTLYDPTREELAESLQGEPRYRLDQLWAGLYTQLAAPVEITNVPKALRERLAAELPPALTQVVRRVSDNAHHQVPVGTRRRRPRGDRADGGNAPSRQRQVGCDGVRVLRTGQAGFTRHLTVGEIVSRS